MQCLRDKTGRTSGVAQCDYPGYLTYAAQSSQPFTVSIDVPEIRILAISQIVKGVYVVVVPRLSDACRRQLVLLPVLPREVETKENDHDHEKNITAHMCRLVFSQRSY